MIQRARGWAAGGPGVWRSAATRDGRCSPLEGDWNIFGWNLFDWNIFGWNLFAAVVDARAVGLENAGCAGTCRGRLAYSCSRGSR